MPLTWFLRFLVWVCSPLWLGVGGVGVAVVDVVDGSGVLGGGEGFGEVLDGGGVVDGVEGAVFVEVDLGAFHPEQDDGVFGVVFGAVEGVDGAAGLVQVGAGGLGLVGVFAVEPAAFQRVDLGGAGVVVDGQDAAGGQGGHDHALAVFGVQAQGLEVDAGGERVLEQRDVG